MSRYYEKIPPKDSWDPIDEALYGPEEPYRVDVDEADRLRLRAVKFSFNHHYNHNRFYHELCKYRGVKLEDVKTLEDMKKIPLIPVETFKQYPEPKRFLDWLRGISSDDVKYPRLDGSSYQELIDRLNEHGLVVNFSSGSSGRNTFIPRDSISLSRGGYFMRFSNRLQRLDDPDSYFFWLGPNIAASNWAVNYFNYNFMIPTYEQGRVYLGMNTPRITVDTFRFQTRILTKQIIEEAYLKVIQILKDLDKNEAKGIICGSPLMLKNFFSYNENLGKRFTLGDRWIIQTGGGWKRSENEAISQEALWEKAERVLGIPERNCRDLYAMCECLVTFPSCERHYYHIPHTLIHPFVLDEDLEPMGFGVSGRFAFVDTLAHAYPGYIITGDKVKLLESCPSCNRTGPVIAPPITRMAGVEDKGCSNVVRKLMAEEVAKT